MENRSSCQIRFDRSMYQHEQFRNDFDYQKPKSKFRGSLNTCRNCDKRDVKKLITRTVPATEWLVRYNWKKDFLPDLTSGITVAIMHIPQGMAYGLLGNVPPVVGIYMAFFPVLMYVIFGTSRHNSMGTFAIVCLMTGKAVLEHSHSSFFYETVQTNGTIQVHPTEKFYTPIQVATTVTFTVALFQLIMYILRLGAISALLSETLVSGFTTAAACLVITSQVKDLCGLDIPRHKGFFVVIRTIDSIIQNISSVNYTALIISGITIIISAFNNEVIKPIVAKRTSFPVPIELIAIVIGTVISYCFNLEEDYAIRVVGNIPSGLPEPELPQFSLIGSIILDAFTIAVVSYSISLSMALIFAQKLNYEVDANQELLAQGVGNVFGSFFSCMPVTASLSRSTIQQTVGGRTQMASVVSCSILLIVLLWIGPYFESLPKCVLASVIVVALKSMIIQVKDFFKFWKLSKMDAIVWLVTFLTVIFVSIDIGLLIGVIISLITIFVLSFKPYTCLMGFVPHTEIFVDINKYKTAKEIPGIKIFHYSGGINFASRGIFKSKLLEALKINPQQELKYKTKLAKYNSSKDLNLTDDKNNRIATLEKKINKELKFLILDFSRVSYIDPSGTGAIQIIVEIFKKIDIPVYIAGSSEPVFEMMSKCAFVNNSTSLQTFPTLHDAVMCALSTLDVDPCDLPAIFAL